MTAPDVRVFWVDAEDDRDRASDGVSRFGAYVRQAGPGFASDVEFYGDPAVAFAVRAWTVACPPVMCPGFVRWHPRVLDARACQDECAGDLRVTVDLVAELPERVCRAAGWSWRSWDRDEASGFREPVLRRAGKDRALLPTLTMAVLISAGSLPAAAPAAPVDWRVAVEAVRVICRTLNSELGPVVAALDRGGERRG